MQKVEGQLRKDEDVRVCKDGARWSIGSARAMSVTIRRAGGRQHLRVYLTSTTRKSTCLFFILYSRGVLKKHTPIERTVSSFRCYTPILKNIRTHLN
ncbi:unnamed protein product [Arctia plantaginis]|uniref:Uncharacterized protein n=1 Tax=Arctia plantaginis TaxID=874455 RepID=A0A8S1AC69_ARCPL|nr:unnamed protein product [Arctia plantaginis]CAB3243332.1 unnamed protein product [Arctia plantaginis]